MTVSITVGIIIDMDIMDTGLYGYWIVWMDNVDIMDTG